MMCTPARPPDSWSSVASLRAATVGWTVLGRNAISGLIRSVSRVIAPATVNGSNEVEL
ncbi:hypothetical protein SAMN05216377_12054 [Pseudonocardia oroxyli]|uniref:Uncharacterized protein n=1 Tax=Pseudonocardia oroxyli TaxID=366584 RepID=A0A1G8AID3_PSEOR|nr:hypothetical protein SAMN05216377_12054 [Pseudonocardia oroxyli]